MKQDLNKEQLDAVNELLNKIPPEDLEKAVGGVSPKTRRIIGGLGLAALAAATYGLYKYKRDEWGPPITPEELQEYSSMIANGEVNETLFNRLKKRLPALEAIYKDPNKSKDERVNAFLLASRLTDQNAVYSSDQHDTIFRQLQRLYG